MGWKLCYKHIESFAYYRFRVKEETSWWLYGLAGSLFGLTVGNM